MILKITSVLASIRRKIQEGCKDLVKVTVMFIRRRTVGKKKREKHFLFPTLDMGAKTQNGGSQLLVLYWRAGEIHMVKDKGAGWLRWLLKQGGVTVPNHPVTTTTQVTETIGCFRISLP
jgi:hypothetical protein